MRARPGRALRWTTSPRAGCCADALDLAIDDAGVAYIAFEQQFQSNDYGRLYVHRNTSGTWLHRETMGQPRFSTSVAIDVDPSGLEHVVYSDRDQGLGVGTYMSPGFGFDMIDTVSLTARISRISINGGETGVGYCKDTGVWFAGFDGVDWTIEQVHPGDIYSCDMKLDSSGQPHFVFVHFVGNVSTASYATKIAGAWQIVPVATASQVAIALDSASHPHIVYYHSTSGLSYAH